MTNEC